jgi:ABC-type polysaccharide transport system permease subunit
VGIEDFLWAAAVGGMASVVAEILLKERLSVIRKATRKRHFAPLVVVVVAFIALELWHRDKTIYNTIIAFAIGAVVIAYLRSDLIPTMLILRLRSVHRGTPFRRNGRSHLEGGL